MGTGGDAIDVETVSRNLMEPVFALEADGTVAFANERFLTISQLDREDAVGAHYDVVERIVEDGFDDFRDALDAVASGDADDERVELSMLHPAAAPVPRRLPAEARITPIRTAGERVGVLVVLRNVSERNAHERQLERQKERLSEFASVVSHDLRNPMNVAEGYLDLAAEECNSEYLESVRDALARMNAIVEGTLTLARQGQRVGELERVVLADVVERCWRNVETGDADLEVDGDLIVLADVGRLESLLENLIRNSVEHGSTGSRSPAHENSVEHSSTGSRASPDDAVDHGGPDVTVRVGPLEEGGFFVEDDGVGVPADEREQAFELGYSGAAEGTGFGLAIVRWIAEAHGWDVTLTEAASGGARFEITGVDVA